MHDRVRSTHLSRPRLKAVHDNFEKGLEVNSANIVRLRRNRLKYHHVLQNLPYFGWNNWLYWTQHYANRNPWHIQFWVWLGRLENLGRLVWITALWNTKWLRIGTDRDALQKETSNNIWGILRSESMSMGRAESRSSKWSWVHNHNCQISKDVQEEDPRLTLCVVGAHLWQGK